MEAIALSILNNTCFSNPILLLGETVCRLLPVVSCKTLSFHSKISSIRAQTTYKGGSLSLGRGFSRRAFKEDYTSDNNSSRKEKLIELFKRIQIEISEGKSGSGIYSESTQASKDDDSSVEMSVLEFLQQSSRETKVEGSKLKHSEESNRKKPTSEEKSISVPELPSKYTCLPSNFVRKSQIPLTTAFQSNEIDLNNKEGSSSEVDKVSFNQVEGMKLSELKELAKERGIKGYSKLKKSELIELLKSWVKCIVCLV